MFFNGSRSETRFQFTQTYVYCDRIRRKCDAKQSKRFHTVLEVEFSNSSLILLRLTPTERIVSASMGRLTEAALRAVLCPLADRTRTLTTSGSGSEDRPPVPLWASREPLAAAEVECIECDLSATDDMSNCSDGWVMSWAVNESNRLVWIHSQCNRFIEFSEYAFHLLH